MRGAEFAGRKLAETLRVDSFVPLRNMAGILVPQKMAGMNLSVPRDERHSVLDKLASSFGPGGNGR